jgi:hypothetical protein
MADKSENHHDSLVCCDDLRTCAGAWHRTCNWTCVWSLIWTRVECCSVWCCD